MGKKYEKISGYYKPKLSSGKQEYEMLGWESKSAHHKRFEALIKNVDLERKSILDVGCGVGSLLGYLKENKINAVYTGVDIMPDMIEIAKKNYPQGDFRCVDIFSDKAFEDKTFDVVYASGIFNLNLGNNVDFLKKATALFKTLSKGKIVFNLLHVNSPDKEDDKYFYFDPKDLNEILGGNLKIIEGYLLNDFTVVIDV